MNEIVSKYTAFLKKPKFILILGLVGILLIFFSSFFSSNEKKEEMSKWSSSIMMEAGANISKQRT